MIGPELEPLRESGTPRMTRNARAMLVVIVVAASTATPALAMPARHLHTLRQAEAAFFRAGLPFQSDWSPHRANPYLVPRGSARNDVPARFRPHLIGWAGGSNSSTFATWQVFVFDRDSEASLFARVWCRSSSCTAFASRADNVVYVGPHFKAASRAMQSLRRR